MPHSLAMLVAIFILAMPKSYYTRSKQFFTLFADVFDSYLDLFMSVSHILTCSNDPHIKWIHQQVVYVSLRQY